MTNKILVIAPHPDDEVLGVGGTIARLTNEGNEVYVAIVTKACPPDFSEEDGEIDRREAIAAHRVLGVKETFFMSFPAARLDAIAHGDLNRELCTLCQKLEPDTLYIPFNGDIHLDHQKVFLSALVAARPNHNKAPKFIYAYETLSETNWNAPYLTPNFVPNTFVDISAHLETKIQAMQMYASQIKPFPNERSEESLRALATLRGSTVSCFAAEAFVLIRAIFV
ncbi:MAG: PIG-L deacetylase family protein [Xenococcaceae cyanobacterium]